MKIAQEILNSLKEDSPVRDIRIGVFWTGVWSRKCGIALTLPPGHEHIPAIQEAGTLKEKTALELANLWDSPFITERSVAIAAINSLLDPPDNSIVDLDASEILLEKGAGKRVALVGHFPFAQNLKRVAKELWVLELNPQPGDLPASSAPRIIPQAEIVAITGSALINGTIDQLLELSSPLSFVMVMGPSAPLSPVWFDFGVQVVSSSLILDPPGVLECLSQGGNLHQLVPFGVKKVSLIKK